MKFTALEHIESNCMQFEKLLLGLALYNKLNGALCNPECPAFQNGSCKSYKMMHRGTITQPVSTETVREQAKRLGISISQVRRNKQDGSL